MIYIKNGTVIDPKSGMNQVCDILTQDDRILKIGINLDAQEFFKDLPQDKIIKIQAEGYIVAPGLVDIHSHFRDPGFTEKEDIESGAKAAAKGGYTSVVLMANTNPPVDQIETLQYVIKKGSKTAIHVYTCADITKGMQGQELTDLENLYKNGAVGFTDDGKPILNEDVLREALSRCKSLNVPISLHEENPKYISENGVNAGPAAEYYHIEGSHREAEITMVQRDLEIALQEEGCLNIQHISTMEAVELVRQAKMKSDKIHAEATPHHIALIQDAILECGTYAKVNPPLRTMKDREAIIEGLRDGTIDLIATDHAPHTRSEKERDITKAPSGMIGLETALPIVMTELVEKNKLDILQVLEKMTYNPAVLYHLDAGYLAENGPADIVIFDPNGIQTFHKFASKSQNSPFAGKTFKTEIEYTISDGKVAYIKNMEEINTDEEN